MIYEQRIYTCIPGKLPALLSRFENHTFKIWEKHGIKQAGFWTVLVGDGNHDLHYMLAWDSLADRETQGNVSQADGILLSEVTRPWRAVSTTSCTRCPISTPRRISTRAQALRSARAIAI